MSIICEGVAYNYPLQKRQTLPALQDISLEIKTGEFVALVGPSGCGKSTLLQVFARLLPASKGIIRFTSTTPDQNLPNVGMVFQQHGVFPWLTVLDNVIFGLERHRLTQAEKRARALACLQRLHLTGFEAAYPYQLSGGMQQRVNIARALVSQAPILLMDEPFGSLDAQTRLVMQEELISLWENERQTVVYVTHDIDEALFLSDRVLVMSHRPGRIIADIAVPLTRPRTLPDIDAPQIRKLRWQIWNMLDVKHDLQNNS
jgi:NitT/TauT family transport system ATP-binding protein